MKPPVQGTLLRIFLGEDDRWKGKPLYEEIVMAARRHGLAGATVVKGCMGFGAHSRLHTTKVLRLSQDLPVVVEIVDRVERIESFLEVIDPMIREGLVTLEDTEVRFYRPEGEGRGEV